MNTSPVACNFRSLLCATAAALALSGCGILRRADNGLKEPELAAIDSPAAPANGAIWQDGHDIPLFENTVARNVGDILTIVLVESMDATKYSSTSTKKATSAELPGPTVAGRPITLNGTALLDAGIGNESKFDGQGSSRQSNSLDGSVTVSVVRRFGNGNLLVRGEKWITINRGREIVRVQGVVRSMDVLPDNSVPSTKVGNAVISYSGRGAVADASAPGLLARFFNSPRTPF